jgi:peptide/nickel transport system permease protein
VTVRATPAAAAHNNPQPPARAGRRNPFLRRLLWRRKSSGVGAVLILLFILVAIAAPMIAPYDYAEQNLLERYGRPSPAHLLGTDAFGRDVLSRIIWGARISLLVGVVAVAIASLLGGTVGIVAGYVGGTVDRILTSLVEMLMAFPLLLIAIGLIAVLGPGLFKVMLAIGLGSVPIFARVLRAETRTVRERDYVAAALSTGASHVRTVLRHILPNMTASLIVLVTTRIATAVLTEASLSFLGLGIRPPTPSWGVLVAEGRALLERQPWVPMAPGVAIMVTVLSLNIFGDGLRDALDVRGR